MGAPEVIEGKDPNERARRYARSVAHAVEAAVPNDFFVARLEETELTGKADLLEFFQTDDPFDIQNTRLATFLKDHPDLANKKVAIKQLKGLQRLYRLQPGAEAALTLQGAGVNSAKRISSMGQNAFVATYGQHFDDATHAREVYANAQLVTASAIALAGDLNLAIDRVTTAAVPDRVASTIDEIPQWSTLFGSLDFCSCGDCQSVYSAPAYLVDVLNFLKDRKAKLLEPESTTEPAPESPSVKDLLFERRPDLGEIELSCENTNTVMPYVDLVLEILEDAVAAPPDFSPIPLDSNRIADLDQGKFSDDLKNDFAGKLSGQASFRVKRPGEWWVLDDERFSYSIRKQENGEPKVETRSRQTFGKQPELAANPQYVNRQAYETLKEAVFPWSLPFDQSLEEARAYLGHLGVSRHQIMEAFTPGERSEVLQSSALAHEFLGLSRKEATLITDPAPQTPWENWGFEEENPGGVSWLKRLGSLSEFLRRSGLEYLELLDLLETRYVNARQVLSIVSRDPDEPDTCEIEKLSLLDTDDLGEAFVGLNLDTASRIIRFVGIWRKLKWSMFDLDRAIVALRSRGISAAADGLTDEFLVHLSHLSRLRQRFNLPVVRLLVFWSSFDTVRYTNQGATGKPLLPLLYDQLFRNRANINPLDPAFTEDPDKLEGTLAEHADAIAAGLAISAADLSVMLENTAVFPQGTDTELSRDTLSHLYRHFALARALRLGVEDYHRALAFINADPFANTLETLLFVEGVTETKDAGLSFVDLDYLLRHQSEASSEMAINDPAIAEHLQYVWRDAQEGTTNEIIERKLEELFRLKQNTVPSLEPQWTSLTEPALADVRNEIKRTIFPVQFGAIARLSGAPNGATPSEEAIADRLMEIRQALQKASAAKEVIARTLAEAFGFEISTVKLLEPQWASMAERALADVPKDLTRENFPRQFNDLVRLHKISRIAEHFNLDAGLLEWLLRHGAGEGLLDLRTLPTAATVADFRKWLRLVNLLALRPAFSRGEEGLLEMLDLAHQTPAPTQDGTDKLVEQTNWNSTDLEFLVGPNGFDLTFPRGFKSEKALKRLRDCFALLKRLGISAEQAMKLSKADVESETAQAVRQAVRAKYDEAQWLKIAKPLRDVLREKQRAALVAYLVTHIKVPLSQLQTPHPDLSQNNQGPAVRELQQKLNAAGAHPPLIEDGEFDQATEDALVVFQTREGIDTLSVVGTATWTALDQVRRNLRDSNELYALFLIDVEMAPCMMTSRIKQAISSVQLFVQRCLMNLEPKVLASSETDEAWDWWKWMKSYRVWEANRKVFLYPENWIEPELRDDKSPFFKELESELMESDLTLESAESAFLNYVEKLDQVARLGVRGVYHEKTGDRDILHVFARTGAAPRVYYYRQRVNSAYWTPWEKVDLDIEGHHLIPVMWNSRLFLFWPIFLEKSKPAKLKIRSLAKGGAIQDQTQKYWEMKLAWSERKQGQWTSKKISSGADMIEQRTIPRGGPEESKLALLSKIFFYPEIQGNDLAIHQLFDTGGLITLATTQRQNDPIGPHIGPGGEVDPDTGDVIVDPPPAPDPPSEEDDEGPSRPDFSKAQAQFLFQGCHLSPQISRYTASNLPVGRYRVLHGTERGYMFFREREESGLALPARIELASNAQVALTKTPGRYRVATQGADSVATRIPFFFEDPARGYLVTPTLPLLLGDRFIDPSEVGGAIAARRVLPSAVTNTADLSPTTALGTDSQTVPPFIPRSNIRYSFQTFYHPYVCPLISILNREGLDQMLRREVQLDPHRFMPGPPTLPFDFQQTYLPNPELVARPFPTEELDFGFSGSYSSYNWELFFHAPLLIADRLTKNQRFAEAAKWFHYIFNPTDASNEPAPQRYWQTKEFFEKTNEDYQQNRLKNLFEILARASELRQITNPTPQEQRDLRSLDDLQASIKAWRDQPFKPHLVARMRTTAYQKTVVMKYLDNLIAWGDQLFRRDTLETLNEATQLYVLAADILGPRPVEVPARLTPQVQTYNSLEPRLDDFSNALVEIEGFIPVDTDPGVNVPEQQPPSILFFCIPKNDKLLGYWDTVADRLFKLRHCMNIEGVVRQLPLFEPPIDPALLVRGFAAGLDLNSLLNDVAAVRPGYRFNVFSQKATELVGEVKSLGANLLATLEKRDAEQLSLLRAKRETGLLEMIEQVREQQLEEANASAVALQKSRELAVSRYLHYQALLGVENGPVPAVGQVIPEIAASPMAKISVTDGLKQISHETAEMTALAEAAFSRGKATGASLMATHLAQIPDTAAEPMGVGTNFVLMRLPSELATLFGIMADESTYQAGLSSRNAQFVMRAHEWTLQNNVAAREIMQIDKQILAAEIRTEIARLELRNHRKQIENAREVEEFMRDKYTNKELYSWMVGQVSGVYFQAYQLAYETAKRTELCFRHELGLTTSNFVQFGYWDSLKKGLMAGEKLHHDLKRMEVAYLDANTREFELTKHVSLVSLDPEQFLTLKETGSCEFKIPEWLFDLDTPGHFMRRLKMVSLTIPCVTGPYTSINCKLELVKNEYRQKADLPSGTEVTRYDRDDTNGPDARFVDNLGVVERMVTSTAQNDAGLFEPNMRDERYLPFEGAGAISTWRLELPMAFKSFDYGTISDVILHLRYTARDGGDALSEAATASARNLLNEPAGDPPTTTPRGLARLFSLRHEFPSEWHRFVSSTPGAGGSTITVDLARTRFPYFVQGREISVNKATVFERTSSAALPQIAITPPGQTTPTVGGSTSFGPLPGLAQGISTARGKPGTWTFGTDSNPKDVEDVFVIFEYSVSERG